MPPPQDAEQAPHDDDKCQLYILHAGVEQDDEVVGFVTTSHFVAEAKVPVEVLQSTVRVWVPVVPQMDTEQAPHDDEVCHLNVSHAGAEHAVVDESLVAASHLEAAVAAPLVVLHSTTLVWKPVEPQVDVEQAPHDEECHLG